MNKTQCPHCFKVYTISDEQYNASDGIVSCGACQQEFYASFVDEIIELSELPVTKETKPSAHRSRLRPPNYGFDESVNSEISIRFDEDDSENIFDTTALEDHPSFGPSSYSLKIPETKATVKALELPTSTDKLADNLPKKRRAPSLEELSSHADVDLINEVDQLIEEKILTAPVAAELADQIEDISTNEIDSDTVSEIIGDTDSDNRRPRTNEFKIQREKTKPFKTFVLTPLLLTILAVVSVALLYQLWLRQIIFWPDQPVVQNTIGFVTKPIKKKFEQYNIVLPLRRNLNGLQLLAADIEPHATRASTILLRVSLINRAKISQALPTLELSLTDADGRLVSRRSLNPEAYLHNNRTNNAIGINELKKVTIELLAFPKQATGYELRILGESAE